MTNALDHKALAQMDYRVRQIVGLAQTGDIAEAEARMIKLVRDGELSGQDRWDCEAEVARARNG